MQNKARRFFSQHRRVVVTGMGLVTPLGCSLDSFWHKLTSNVCAIQHYPRTYKSQREQNMWNQVPPRLAACINKEEFAALVQRINTPHVQIMANRMTSFIQYAMVAAQLALDDAQWHPKTYAEEEETGVAVGSGIGGIEEYLQAHQLLLDGVIIRWL